MRNKFRFGAFLAILGCGIMMVSCMTNKSKGGKSNTTGWNYNDPNYGGFFVTDSKEQKTGPGLVAIEGGTFTMGATQENVYYEWDNTPRQVTVSSFFMDQTEVSNTDYLEYIYWLNRIYGDDYPDMIEKALPDTLVWRNTMSYNEPMVEIYFRHPAYGDYPVVGVSWLQANDYALWRSDRVNEMLLIEAGVLKFDENQTSDNHFTTDGYLAGTYTGVVDKGYTDYNPKNTTGKRSVKMEDGILLPKYRLPTEAEWEYAALGLIGNTEGERITQRKTYPWNSEGVRSQEKNYTGTYMANFKRGAGDYMGVAGSLNDGATFPAPVTAYWPNDYGLYNMAGNVAEWVLDVYRPLSFEDFADQNPYRGDSENINYRDGDYMSTIQNDWNNKEEQDYTKQMYDYGKTTLISDHSRVYKGGSWADGPYYLSPATRRFLDENQSSSTIGFRCAMNKIGTTYGK